MVVRWVGGGEGGGGEKAVLLFTCITMNPLPPEGGRGEGSGGVVEWWSGWVVSGGVVSGGVVSGGVVEWWSWWSGERWWRVECGGRPVLLAAYPSGRCP